MKSSLFDGWRDGEQGDTSLLVYFTHIFATHIFATQDDIFKTGLIVVCQITLFPIELVLSKGSFQAELSVIRAASPVHWS